MKIHSRSFITGPKNLRHLASVSIDEPCQVSISAWGASDKEAEASLIDRIFEAVYIGRLQGPKEKIMWKWMQQRSEDSNGLVFMFTFSAAMGTASLIIRMFT